MPSESPNNADILEYDDVTIAGSKVYLQITSSSLRLSRIEHWKLLLVLWRKNRGLQKRQTGQRSKSYPFQLAAVGDKQCSQPVNKGEWQLDVVYTLLRRNPILAAGMISHTPWQRTEKKMKAVEKQRDDWKSKANEWKRKTNALGSKVDQYQCENEELKRKLAELTLYSVGNYSSLMLYF